MRERGEGEERAKEKREAKAEMVGSFMPVAASAVPPL